MERKPFPTDQESFGDDDRISYSKLTQTFILEDENGTEWEWLSAVNKWTQTVWHLVTPVWCEQALACVLTA